MRLIIKDYLLQLKEKDELDFLICDLLRQKGYIIDSIPKSGNRQYGVDIKAHNRDEVLLFVVKQGNIDRKVWDTEQNAVRQSINEIFDTYLINLSFSEKKKKIQIIVATNGFMDENVVINWNGYVNSQSKYHEQSILINFWSIDEITKQVQEFLFNEYLLPSDVQSDLRKALYFIEERNYKPIYYERAVDYYFLQMTNVLTEETAVSSRNARLKKYLSSLFLATQMIVQYAHTKKHYKIGINVNEYLMIRFWKFLLDHKLLGKENYSMWLVRFCKEYEKSNDLYYNTIKEFCENKVLFPRYGEIIEQRLMIYEILGYLSSYAYYKLCYYGNSYTIGIVNTIVLLLTLNPEYQYPPFDSNICQLSMLFRLLSGLGREDESKALLSNLCIILPPYYRIFHKYPTSEDSYLDAINIEKGNEHDGYKSSGLWGYFLLWIYLFDDEETYMSLIEFLTKDIEKVTKCVWFMRKEEETLFYNYFAMNLSGDGVAIRVNEKYEDFRKQIGFIVEQYKNEHFSYEEYSFLPLELIVCRYYGYVPRVIRE